MPKSPNQKLKLLILQRFLTRCSDEAHPVTVQEMIEELARHDVAAERKTIYDDLETLRRFGLDIVQRKDRSTGYYVASRDFELPELKLLVDSIQSSKFITQKKTLSLIRKLENLASVYEAQLLERQVYVRGRVKSMNESVYYNVDEISGAITRDRAIRFKYFEFTLAGERRYRHEGAWYTVSPFALIWDDENYYLLAWDASAERMKHFRVDKMTNIEPTEQRREGKETFKKLDMSSYTQRVFGMFGGEQQRVRLRFLNHLAGAVIDRFGKDTILTPDGDEHFIIAVDLVVSPQFFAWVFGFGAEAEILSPEAVRLQMGREAAKIAARYE
ncbi:MAG: WYL domain-containing protein [Oscillospiraceae bacterium]|nr:WYL domain-containing protein [Oscillospiraceae bacterium]